MCVANSARSQLAEAIARKHFKSGMQIYSAGSKPSSVNPSTIKVLQENGLSTLNLYSKSVDDLPAAFIDNLDFVITLCAEEVCPVIQNKAQKLHWPFADPAHGGGDEISRLHDFRAAYIAIEEKILSWNPSQN